MDGLDDFELETEELEEFFPTRGRGTALVGGPLLLGMVGDELAEVTGLSD